MTVTLDENEFSILKEQLESLSNENKDLKDKLDTGNITIGYIRHIIKSYAENSELSKIIVSANEDDTEGIIHFKGSVQEVAPLLELYKTPSYNESKVSGIMNRLSRIFN